jgi:hypothetical protein
VTLANQRLCRAPFARPRAVGTGVCLVRPSGPPAANEVGHAVAVAAAAAQVRRRIRMNVARRSQPVEHALGDARDPALGASGQYQRTGCRIDHVVVGVRSVINRILARACGTSLQTTKLRDKLTGAEQHRDHLLAQRPSAPQAPQHPTQQIRARARARPPCARFLDRWCEAIALFPSVSRCNSAPSDTHPQHAVPPDRSNRRLNAVPPAHTLSHTLGIQICLPLSDQAPVHELVFLAATFNIAGYEAIDVVRSKYWSGGSPATHAISLW